MFQTKYVAECLDEIKNELRQENVAVKAMAVNKLTYVRTAPALPPTLPNPLPHGVMVYVPVMASHMRSDVTSQSVTAPHGDLQAHIEIKNYFKVSIKPS